jgi:hypothetical protein
LDRPSRLAEAITRTRRTLWRYRRDLDLMEGRVDPVPSSLDDLAIMEYFAASDDRARTVRDRRLRILTLRATLEALLEAACDEAAASDERGRTPSGEGRRLAPDRPPRGAA